VTRRSPAAAAVLAIPTAAFGVAVRLRNAWYNRSGVAVRAPVPVISVGNLAVGGTGKTPLVAWIARRLRGEGLVPAVVSRGYGGTAGVGPLVVSTGEGPRVNARTAGDEPHLLARALKGVIVIVGSNRIEGARSAAAAGAGVVVLDDGFQHRRLARDLDLVALDARAPFADGHLLPRGSLREPPYALRRAQVVILTRVREDDAATAAIDAVRRTGYGGPIVRAGHRIAGFSDAAGARRDPPKRALAFCGIGDPALFREDLAAAGVTTEGFHAFRDHQPYTLAGWDALVAEARGKGVALVTTEKDLSRLEAAAGASLARAELAVLRIEVVVWDEKRLLDAVRGALLAHAGNPAR
jgi:tetraacyldisaccharide 4'-kinase